MCNRFVSLTLSIHSLALEFHLFTSLRGMHGTKRIDLRAAWHLHSVNLFPMGVKGKILRSTKPNKPMKTMNKKIGRRRKHFPFMCVKDGTVVTKCSWKMTLVSDCVVNS